jgi:hypothetical protein
MKDRLCCTCKHWDAQVEQFRNPNAFHLLNCLRHAPIVIAIGERPSTVWPSTHTSDTCGDWQFWKDANMKEVI